MRSKTLCSGERYIDKNACHKNKSLISINEIDINGIVLFIKTLYGNKGSFKCYIGNRHKDGSLSPLSVKLPQLTAYAKHFNNGDNFLIADKELLKRYNEIWDKIKSLFKEEFDKKYVYDKK